VGGHHERGAARSAAAATVAKVRYANMVTEHSMVIAALLRRLGEILVRNA